MPIMKIDSFDGQYRFLSNFYPCCVVHDGIPYPSAEHAFQAAKSVHIEVREFIAQLPTPAAAKKRGRKIELRHDWDNIKDLVMFQIVLSKFATNDDIRVKLINTYGAKLIEGNSWGDQYWGVCDGVGENMLGQILMQVRGLFQ